MKKIILLGGTFLVFFLLTRLFQHSTTSKKPSVSVMAIKESLTKSHIRNSKKRFLTDKILKTDSKARVYFDRDETEWQGMKVEMEHPPCYSGVCGMAMACIDEKCGPCSEDLDCGNEEVCVLQHCVLEENTDCRTKDDCDAEDALCVLTGYSNGVRGNAEMKAFCLSSSEAGEPQVENIEERNRFDAERGPYQPASVEFTDLAKGLIYEKNR